jgi:hypothetical protein
MKYGTPIIAEQSNCKHLLLILALSSTYTKPPALKKGHVYMHPCMCVHTMKYLLQNVFTFTAEIA